MAQPRHQLVDLQKTPYYHVTSRCVRRAFLCGYDKVTKKSYEHRRIWIEERIRLLSSVFAIKVCAYAVMRNHYHIVVKICPDKTFDWSQDEVIQRWSCLFSSPVKVDDLGRIDRSSGLSESEILRKVEICRLRLASLSWFMRCINEPLARRANREDDVSGHFWEARFKSQALLNEAIVLACMVYVDLNPVRANEALTPERARYTSFRERIVLEFKFLNVARQHVANGSLLAMPGSEEPLAFFEVPGRSQSDALPITFSGYIHLVDYTQSNGDSSTKKPPSKLLAMFDRLKIQPDVWCHAANNFEQTYQKYWKSYDAESSARSFRAH